MTDYYNPPGTRCGVLPGSNMLPHNPAVSEAKLPGSSPLNLRDRRADEHTMGFKEYEDATDVQVAEAALAGWKVHYRGQYSVYPWSVSTPDDQHVSVFIGEREAWSAAWHCLQAALLRNGEVC